MNGKTELETAGATLEKSGKGTTQHKTGRAEQPAEDRQFIYCGPSIPGRLNENAVLQGTREDIQRYYADVLKRYPQADGLIVPVCRLAEIKQRLRIGGNIAYKRYQDIASMLRNGKNMAVGGE